MNEIENEIINLLRKQAFELSVMLQISAIKIKAMEDELKYIGKSVAELNAKLGYRNPS